METVWNPSVKFPDEIGEEGAVIIPVHLLQDLIISALNGNVEMGTDLARPGEKRDKTRRKISGLDRAQSNPQEVSPRFPPVPEGLSRETEGTEVKAIGAEVDAGKHNFLISLLIQILQMIQNPFRCKTPRSPSGIEEQCSTNSGHHIHPEPSERRGCDGERSGEAYPQKGLLPGYRQPGSWAVPLSPSRERKEGMLFFS